MDNTEGKSHDTIPCMIVNLDYHDVEYISKDTPIAYIHDEDISCEYLEVNEVVESPQGINWLPPRKRKILNSDRYRVPEFPHSSVTFNIISGFRILASPKVL